MKYFEFKLAFGETEFMREDLVRRVSIHNGPDKHGVTGVVFYDGVKQEFEITNTLPEIRKILGLEQETKKEEKYIVRRIDLTSDYAYVFLVNDKTEVVWTTNPDRAAEFDLETAEKIALENNAGTLRIK